MKLVYTMPFLLIACANEAEQTTEVIESPEMITMRIDFGEESGDDWFVLNDDVMGGVSTGEIYLTDTTLVFEGNVSTDQNGGFVSIRSPTGEYDLSQYSQVEFRYKSEGHTFSMILADKMMWYLPEFMHEVMSESDEWTTQVTSLYDFRQYTMSSETGVSMSEEMLADMIRLEIRNSTFTDGLFRLEIDYLEFQGFIEE